MADAMCTGESPPLIPANVCGEILNFVRTAGETMPVRLQVSENGVL